MTQNSQHIDIEEGIGNTATYRCPICGSSESIDVTVLASAKLTQSSDGNFETEVDGDHEFAGSMRCRECNYSGPEEWFAAAGQEGLVVVKRTDGGSVRLNPEKQKIEGRILVGLSDIISAGGLEGCLDLFSEKLVGHSLLMDFASCVAGAVSGQIEIDVAGFLDNEHWHEFLNENIKDNHLTTCSICGEKILAKTAHQHDGGYIGAECCWDERLRATE